MRSRFRFDFCSGHNSDLSQVQGDMHSIGYRLKGQNSPVGLGALKWNDALSSISSEAWPCGHLLEQPDSGHQIYGYWTAGRLRNAYLIGVRCVQIS